MNQIPWASCSSGRSVRARACDGTPATSPEYTGRPVRRAWAQRPSAAAASRCGPGSRDRGSNPGQPRCRPRGRRRNGIRHRRTAAFQQRLTRWARMSGDCAARPRDRHPWGRVSAVLERKRRAQAAQGRRELDHAETRADAAADESVLPVGHVSPFSLRNAEAQKSGIPPAAKSWLKPTDLGAACLRAGLGKTSDSAGLGVPRVQGRPGLQAEEAADPPWSRGNGGLFIAGVQ